MPKKGEIKYWQLWDRNWLYQKYWIEKLSSSKIAKIVGCSHKAVLVALRRLNISIRTISEANKGQIPWNKDKQHTEETKQKMRENHADYRGEKHPLYRKHHSEETRRKMREKAKKRCESKEERERLSQMRKHQKFPKNHTKIELTFEEICKKYNLPFRYVGDGSLWIGKKGGTQINPDFIECNGKKIAIFVNGDYWHSPLLRYNIRNSQRVDWQIKICKHHKWIPVIIWESDLKREDAGQFVLSILKKEKIII